MSPQSGAARSAHTEDLLAETSAEVGTTDPMKQFIWENAAVPADEAGPDGAESDVQDVTAEKSGSSDEVPTRIVVLSEDEEDEEETSDSWRRQLISALRDADRDASSTRAHPTDPPPIPPAEIPRRPPIALVAGRQGRGVNPLPVERRPRNRMAPVLFGVSAAAGLLTIAVPRIANTPEAAADMATSAQIVTGSLVPAAGDDTLKPIIMNSPVLIREGMSMLRAPKASLPVGPVIETVRTVPVQIGSAPLAGTQTTAAAPAVEPPMIPLTLPQPPPAPPLDRESLAALIYDEPVAPPEPSATVVPLPTRAPVEPTEKATNEPPETRKPAKARNPQVSNAYQRSIREKPRAKSASKKRAQTASRSSERVKRNAHRVRTSATSTEVKEVEPSTMVKLLKSLNPFASKDDAQTRPKKNIFE